MTAPTGLYRTMAALVADLDGQHRRERAAYERGYRDGHRSGWETGYGHAHHEMADRWAHLAKHVRELARTHPYAELNQRRWDGNRADFARPRPTDRQRLRLAAQARRSA
ncbi:hypothetical protein [Streptosporangium saharense]|uniref:Uncharacterized protein n=1 Tax=Streptosporangium saharense TaxID=1706840 RepID=A0A7W7QGT2_9ACTN|nr:hypothetical protein [Streptosporangium saharense]MBB4913325.1 hypothetical protein [Streptosporangium saharense]